MSTIDITPPPVSVAVLEMDVDELDEREVETVGQANYIYKVAPANGEWAGLVFDFGEGWAIAPTGGVRYDGGPLPDGSFATKETAMWFLVTMIDLVKFECYEWDRR